MNSKRFVCATVAIVGGIILVIWTAAWLLPMESYMDGEYGFWMQQRDYAKSKHDTEDSVILLGDSRMKLGVDPQAIGGNVYNLALAGGTPIEMYYTLKNYLVNNKPRAVVIGFAPTHFMHMESYTQRSLYFHYFNRDEVMEINENVFRLDGKDFKAEAVQYEYYSPAVYLNGLIHSVRENRTEINQETYKEASTHNGGLSSNDNIAKQDDCPEETKDAFFRVSPVLDYYFRSTIELCLSNNIPIEVIQLPINKEGFLLLEKTGYYSQYIDYMESVRNDYGIAVVVDIPAYEREYFMDGSHLNKRGSERFVATLKRYVVSE